VAAAIRRRRKRGGIGTRSWRQHNNERGVAAARSMAAAAAHLEKLSGVQCAA